MTELLYGELSPWYRLLTPVEDYAEEAALYERLLAETCDGPSETLLELGCGAGHNAFYLKNRFRCTLTDLSPRMLALSEELNPGAEHLLGDMRTLRLGRTFDVVLVHDAIMYMKTERELRAAIDTAAAHLRPGGAALFAPDCFRETFVEEADILHTGSMGSRALRCLEWDWDPDPNDESFMTELVFVLRDGSSVTTVHDRHEFGLFSRQTWLDSMRSVGLQPTVAERHLEDTDDEIFVARYRSRS